MDTRATARTIEGIPPWQTRRRSRAALWRTAARAARRHEKQGYDLVIASAPDVSRLTIGVLALVAEQERRDISIRIKAALAKAKARDGVGSRADRLLPLPATRQAGSKAKAR